MSLLGTWRGPDGWHIYRTGEPLDEGGDGVIWRCTCSHGEPMGDEEANERAGYPCKHLRSIWRYACEHGVYDPHVDWTKEGIELGQRCRCRSREPIALQFGPPLETPPERVGPALNAPCPCGSGRKFKKCEGFGPGRPYGPAHPLREPPQIVGVPLVPAPPPAPPEPTPEEQKRRKRAEKRAAKDEAKAAKAAALDVTLARIRAEEERKALRRKERAMERKIEALRKIEEAEAARRAKDERLQKILDDIRAKEEARREARRLRELKKRSDLDKGPGKK